MCYSRCEVDGLDTQAVGLSSPENGTYRNLLNPAPQFATPLLKTSPSVYELIVRRHVEIIHIDLTMQEATHDFRLSG